MRRCGFSFYALSRQPSLFAACRCGDFGFVSRHKPAGRHTPDVSATPDVEASCITSCRGRRLFLSSTFSLRCVVFCLFAGKIGRETDSAKWFLPSQNSLFKVGVPPSCCSGNFHSFSMTIFTGRGRHHSSSGGRGAWVQCCHVEQFRLHPSWSISL